MAKYGRGPRLRAFVAGLLLALALTLYYITRTPRDHALRIYAKDPSTRAIAFVHDVGANMSIVSNFTVMWEVKAWLPKAPAGRHYWAPLMEVLIWTEQDEERRRAHPGWEGTYAAICYNRNATSAWIDFAIGSTKKRIIVDPNQMKSRFHPMAITVTRDQVLFYFDGQEILRVNVPRVKLIRVTAVGESGEGTMFEIYVDEIKEYWDEQLVLNEDFEDSSDDYFNRHTGGAPEPGVRGKELVAPGIGLGLPATMLISILAAIYVIRAECRERRETSTAASRHDPRPRSHNPWFRMPSAGREHQVNRSRRLLRPEAWLEAHQRLPHWRARPLHNDEPGKSP